MSGIVPLRRSAIRRLLPSTGSRRVSSPASSVVRGVPTACRPSRRTSLSFVWRYRSLRSRFAPVLAKRRQLQARGFVYPAIPHAGQRAETAEPPRFLGNPSVHMPCSSTPVGPSRQAISALRCCLPPLLRRQLPRQTPCGAQSHGLHTRCLRFVTRVTPGHARLASGCWPALPGGVDYPLGSIAEFQSSLHLIPPAQALPGALKNHGGRAVPRQTRSAAGSRSASTRLDGRI